MAGFFGTVLADYFEGSADNDIMQGYEGDDVLYGQAGHDELYGHAGNDTLDGGLGIDTMIGGEGNDQYSVDHLDDVVGELVDDPATQGDADGVSIINLSGVVLYAGVEHATIYASQLPAGSSHLLFTDNTLNNVIQASDTHDYIRITGGLDGVHAGSGNDIIEQQTATGFLSVEGGLGDDQYIGYVGYFSVIEEAHFGIDHIYAKQGDYQLPDQVEHLDGDVGYRFIGNVLSNTITIQADASSPNRLTFVQAGGGDDVVFGQRFDDELYGNSGADELHGDAGNDLLHGGTGVDSLLGGLGDDIYYCDQPADQVIEFSGAGIDHVYSSSAHYQLSAQVEHLTLTTTANLSATGNDLHNRMTGNLGNNLLSGGNGRDVLSGMLGNDILYGGNDQDTLLGGQDQDRLYGGASHDHLQGGVGADQLFGGFGDDRIDGGLGNDLLSGQGGADTYIVRRQDGQDRIIDVDTSSAVDQCRFDSSIASSQLWFERQGDDLKLHIIGTTDQQIIEGWFLGSNHQIEQFIAGDGRMLQASDVTRLIDAMASLPPPALGQTSLSSTYQTQLAATLSMVWL